MLPGRVLSLLCLLLRSLLVGLRSRRQLAFDLALACGVSKWQPRRLPGRSGDETVL